MTDLGMMIDEDEELMRLGDEEAQEKFYATIYEDGEYFTVECENADRVAEIQAGI